MTMNQRFAKVIIINAEKGKHLNNMYFNHCLIIITYRL